MSIFRETFPKFIQEELSRRQNGMATRNPAFTQQLNTRNSWVRLTSGVNYLGTNNLAKQYVLQGGILNGDNLRFGLGGAGTSSYDLKSPGGNTHRLGIRPMPGITGVSIQSKGAYGSLQEATVSFTAWDIKQLEDLELLYMRPGYTVLLEFGWDFAKDKNGVLPKYDILNNATGITSINDAFAQIYQKIEESNGTYDALLGYVKNYNWVARDDGGYNCTTTIISLGEVIESLKCNWVPIETKAFSDSGLLNLPSTKSNPKIKDSYEQGIIPGLLHEIWDYLLQYNPSSQNYGAELIDPIKKTKYQLCMSKTMEGSAKFDRGGYPKPLGTDDKKVEGWITLGSFCDLLNNYVLLRDDKNNPLVQITTNETDSKGNISNTSLKCIANPLSLSTNLGVCLIRNDNWARLGIKQSKSEANDDLKNTPSVPERTTPSEIQTAVSDKSFSNILTFKNKINSNETNGTTYSGDIDKDINDFVKQLELSIVNTNVKNANIEIVLTGNNKFIYKPSSNSNLTTLNWFDYFYPADVVVLVIPFIGTTPISIGSVGINEKVEAAYKDLFPSFSAIKDNKTTYTPKAIKDKLRKALTAASLSSTTQSLIQSATPEVAQDVSEEAKNTLVTSGILQFLVPNNSLKEKTLGNISNIYININYLYNQAISKNVASNDNQNTNNISIREYIQGILREIQNSLGNINQFDIQVDERTSIGRIVDINFTGNPNQNLFQLQIHNTNSVVRNYGFQSKIFPEMGSIIAISAQDASGIGKLGYDNATLVAWNEGISDRLIPKKTFTNDILIPKGEDPASFILPFLTKINNYFEALKGQDKNNINFLFGGLDFAYRDFLANLNRFDPRNNFKTIIPTTLDITLDGIGGMVIGNLFTINQDIVPKGYRNVPGRKLAYIVTKLGHNISDNDWTTELSAYPIIFEQAEGTDVASKWNNQQYPGSTTITVGGVAVAVVKGSFNPNTNKIASFGNIDYPKVPQEAKPLLDTIAYTEGTAGQGNNGYDVIVGYGQIAGWTENYSKGHPNKRVYIESINNYSSAAGRYQFLYDTWTQVAGKLYFNKANQDLAGWELINGKTAAKEAFRIAQEQIKTNSINVVQNPGFITFLNRNYKIWASLPNAGGEAGYAGQGGKYSPEQVYKVYIEAVKKYS